MFEGLTGLIRKFRVPFGKGTEVVFWKKVEVDPSSDQKVKDNNQQVSTFYLFNWAVEFAAEKVRHVARSRKPDLYLIASWIVTVIITSLVYAFEYWSSKPGGFHPEFLTEPCVNLSIHTALVVQTFAANTAQWTNKPGDDCRTFLNQCSASIRRRRRFLYFFIAQLDRAISTCCNIGLSAEPQYRP